MSKSQYSCVSSATSTPPRWERSSHSRLTLSREDDYPLSIWMLLGRAAKAGIALICVVALLLNCYLRFYVLLKPGCDFDPRAVVKIAAFGDPQITGYPQQGLRKKIDVAGNDRFLARVVSSVRDRREPDFVLVLGDLISSQWISTPEFENRARRFSTIFPSDGPGQIVNISGNHDIGYHGEFTDERCDRFVKWYGALNFVAYESDAWRMVVINSLSLDGPPHNDKWQEETLEFLKSLRGYKGSTVLLTHIPMYKPNGICRDGPSFSYYEDVYGSGLRSQNHLSKEATQLVLDSAFEQNNGLILTGHDHEGCLSSYTSNNGEWTNHPGFSDGNSVKEATVRSVMGEYGGNTGLVSGVWHEATKKMQWQFSLCRFHVQHIWWITMVLTYLSAGLSPFLVFS